MIRYKISVKRLNKRLLSLLLATTIIVAAVPDLFVELWNGITSLFVFAESGTVYTAPECEFMEALYDGSDAISPLPSYNEYKTLTGYTEPKLFTLKDFRAQCGEGLLFDRIGAKSYMEQGYKIMICDAEELYLLSQIVNGSGSSDEISFYLSASYVLGNNIEYTEVSYSGNYFKPIGSYTNPFVGSFDGQCFEIRDLYFDTAYSSVTVAFFGVVGEGASVKDFGLYHPYFNALHNSSTYTAGIAAENYGTIDSVYVIAEEYTPDGTVSLNAISSANAAAVAGLVARNHAGGTLSNSYFAGMLDSYDAALQNPVCADNSGTVTNCYYDSQVFAYGVSGTQIDAVEGEITGLKNIDLKKVGISDNGMKNTKFKLQRWYTLSDSDAAMARWDYPRLYGFTGSGTESDPFLISTPADLIFFPNSWEYSKAGTPQLYFALASCIDMNTVAPNAYKPSIALTKYINYISGTKVALSTTYSSTDRYFFGVFTGIAEHGEENCPIHHVTNLGNDYEGNPLQESHIILNLTIDTPATNGTSNDKAYAALIAQTNGYWSGTSSSFYASVENLQLVGGYISTGEGDYLTTTYNSGAYNVRVAAVIANSYLPSNLTNVHSSATVTTGTGKQYSLSIGGLIGYGYFRFVTDCTNSGSIIGGYVELPGESYTSANARAGGLLGSAGAYSNTLECRYLGKLTHVANYGTVSAPVFVTDADNDWILTSGVSRAYGIASVIAMNRTGLVTNNIESLSNGIIHLDDSNRAERIANFGVISDTPLVLDENGDVVWESENKPQVLELDSTKRILENTSPLYVTSIFGIGYNRISHAYNAGNLYSLSLNKTVAAGIGYMNGVSYTTESTNYGAYYECFNYNHGSIYLYNGSGGAYGIGPHTACLCYNDGDIYMYGGEIWTRANSSVSYTGEAENSAIGSFSGITGGRSYGCYNNGSLYIAPSSRMYYYVTTSLNVYVWLSGTSPYMSNYIRYVNSEGTTVNVRDINNGHITLDLETYHFNPDANTTDLTNSNYWPIFGMNGTGSGDGCDNYGTFDFIPYTESYSSRVKFWLAGCGRVCPAVTSHPTRDCNNYADLFLSLPEDCDALGQLVMQGVCNGTYEYYECSDLVNYGNITFSGRVNGTASFRGVKYDGGIAYRCINLGNITLLPGTTITGAAAVYGFLSEYSNSSYLREITDLMNGWYAGCAIPSGFMEENYRERYEALFNSLDPTKRYGQITVSGCDIGGTFTVATSYFTNTANYSTQSRIFNNGAFLIENTEFATNFVVYGLSNGKLSYSENHAPIEVRSFLIHAGNYASSICGAAGGSYNINYADIDVHDFVAESTNNGLTFTVSGVTTVNWGSNHLENRGNITVANAESATVNGVEYQSAVLSGRSGYYDMQMSIEGIGPCTVSNALNLGDITADRIYRYFISGIGRYQGTYTVSDCINYGHLTAVNSGGLGYIGGITAANTTAVIRDCANFGEISVQNPHSYRIVSNPDCNVGGICGNMNNTGAIYSCVNYGKITYTNTQGINTDSSLTNTRAYALYIGGVAGSRNNDDFGYNMNYGDISVIGEENLTIYAGGLIGLVNMNLGNTDANRPITSCINYGNVTISASSANNNVRVGGLFGYFLTGSNISTDYNGIRYAINYGTVSLTNGKTDKTCLGSLIGYRDGNFVYPITYCADLSIPDSTLSSYPLIGFWNYGSRTNTENAVNYTVNEQSVTDTENATNGKNIGTMKVVTLDSNSTTGFFAPSFPFRSKLITAISHNYYTTETIFQNNEVALNQDNGLVYVPYNQLSPYLQTVMTERFGESIQNYGAYVVMEESMEDDEYLDFSDEYYRRGYDEYFPQSLINMAHYLKPEEDSSAETEREANTYSCVAGEYTDAALLADRTVYDTVYADYLAGLGTTRTIQSDLNYYALQVNKSPLAEVLDVHFQTVYEYDSTDTSFYQYFSGYQYLVQEYPAHHSDGTLSENVVYTDVNIYIAVDDIDSYDARYSVYDGEGNVLTDENGDPLYVYFNPEGTISLYAGIDVGSYYSSIRFYQGDTVETSARKDEMNYYIEEYPNGLEYYQNMWLNCDNLSEKLSVAEDWLPAMSMTAAMSNVRYDSDGDGEITVLDDYYWQMEIPYTDDSCIDNMYTKVIGVAASEDGAYQNIIVAHVVIDKYKPSATVHSVTLQTPSDGTVTSTVENGYMTAVEGQPSLTDYDRQNPDQRLNDVTYYYMVDAEGMAGENIEKWNYSSSAASWPTITLDTSNMDKDDNIMAVVTRHDQTPVETGLYNDMVWNSYLDNDDAKAAAGITSKTFYINPTDIEYDDDQTSTGTATLNIDSLTSATDGTGTMFYGGLYRIDLYYERTKDSDTYKHFATVFIAKAYAPANYISRPPTWYFYYQESRALPRYNYSGYDYSQAVFDAVFTGSQTGYMTMLSPWYGYYTNNWSTSKSLLYYYYSRENNDMASNGQGGAGYYYALKAYVTNEREETIYLGADNWAYNSIIEEYLEAKAERDAFAAAGGVSYTVEMGERGIPYALDNQADTIYVHNDETTGDYYPVKYTGITSIMAENGDIRNYQTEWVQSGTYAAYDSDEHTYNHNPAVEISSANKNNFPIVKTSDGDYIGNILGTETNDITFTVQWTSSNVAMYHSDNQPNAIKTNSIYTGDGYNTNKFYIYFTPINSTERRLLSTDEVAKYFTSISCNTNNVWTFKVKNDAPVGVYEFTPYISYHMDFSSNTAQIRLVDADTGETLNAVDDTAKTLLEAFYEELDSIDAENTALNGYFTQIVNVISAEAELQEDTDLTDEEKEAIAEVYTQQKNTFFEKLKAALSEFNTSITTLKSKLSVSETAAVLDAVVDGNTNEIITAMDELLSKISDLGNLALADVTEDTTLTDFNTAYSAVTALFDKYNIFEFTVAYNPLIINNVPNDETYLTEFNVDNDQYTPFIDETVERSDSDERDVYILTASENQEIVYNGYDSYMTGDDRIDAFTIYSYVSKTTQESNLRFKVPYRATLQVWQGEGEPDSGDGEWVDATLIPEYDEDGNEIASDYKQYSDHVTYNELNDDGSYTYSSSITYYRVVAEDGVTMTTYKVYVTPGVRNKATTLEIAQSSETIGGTTEFSEEMQAIFAESDAIYQELLEMNGTIIATIKELNGNAVDVYQSKIFTDSSGTPTTQPYIYNLKSFAYDISVDLPAGYTYDVLIFSQDMDSAQTLTDSSNGFSGKQLILSSSDAQVVNIRIVLRRDTTTQIWGVQYIWNFSKALCDTESGYALNAGGVYYNYVYKKETVITP